MKKIFIGSLFIFLNTAAAMASPGGTNAQIIKEAIVVQPGQTIAVNVPVAGLKLESIKLCSSFDSPAKNVEVKGEIADVWFGSVTKDCTPLDVVGGVALPEESVLKLVCRNFDAVQRTCRVKAVIYTKGGSE